MAADRPADEAQAHRELVERFDRFLIGRGIAPGTRRLYRPVVLAWLAFGGVVGHCDHYRAVSWLAQYRRQGLAVSSLNLRLKALSAFYGYAEAAGLAPLGARAAVPRQRPVPARLPLTLDDGAIGAAMAWPDLATFAGFRDSLIVRLLYESGLRSGELAALTLGDVLPDRTLYVAALGRRPGRYVPISECAWLLLRDYQRLRSAKRVGRHQCLWVRDDGRPLRGGRAVWEIVDRLVRAGLGMGGGYRRLRGATKRRPWSGVYPHLLRATFAKTMLERGTSILALSQMLGHADVATTARYLALDMTQARAAIKLHPRSLRKQSGAQFPPEAPPHS